MLQGRSWKQTSSDDTYDSEQVSEVLRVCGVSVGTELETHFLVYCPFHYNKNTPACEVDKEKGLFICFSCGENGTLLEMVMRTTSRNYFEASRVISNATKTVDFESRIDKMVEVKDEIEEFDPVLIRKLHNNLLETEEGLAYYHSRKIEDDAIKFFNLGYSISQKMVTVPIHTHDNVCVGFVGRSIEGKSFKNSTGLPRNKVLFNLNNIKYKNITIVESSFDVIRLWQLNIPAVATLGANLGKNQIDLLRKYAKSIILASDQDEAGMQLESKLIKALPEKQISKLEFPDGLKDIGDMSDEQIIDAYNSLSSFDIALTL
jgi:DNA primase